MYKGTESTRFCNGGTGIPERQKTSDLCRILNNTTLRFAFSRLSFENYQFSITSLYERKSRGKVQLDFKVK
ncbi:Uncharacterised protein [Bacteroides uniformis]|uniref:Uncharacterized protein n=1 Tax=Bacteroides uniformis TaxID=820 RepID=A0A174S8A1_BACUN|nr:Uncharacterised protein [Bacteroides uniformis]